MHLYTLLAALSVAKVALCQTSSTTGASIDEGGILRLFGNSFGRPGYEDEYDYIIVGAGNAGATIAARLALDPANYSVAIVDVGSFYEITEGNRTQIPGLTYINSLAFPNGHGNTLTIFDLPTEPQAGYNGRRINYIQGQTMGGSTATNAMAYHRPTVGTFDKWSHETNDSFWAWDNVYPAFKKSCHFTPPDYSKIDKAVNITWDPSAFDENGGPLHVSYSNYQGPYGPSLHAAMEQSGLNSINGFNSGRLIGYSTLTATIDPHLATRSSSETSFLQEAARRSSIKIYPQTLAKRVTFDSYGRANGIDVEMNTIMANETYHLSARKEVILSAGVWHSPQLLMLSGIGPADTLQEHGIDVVSHLPGVGQNEEDQPTIPGMFKVNVTTYTQIILENPDVMAAVEQEYIQNQSGPLSGPSTGQGIAFEKIPAPYRNKYSNSTINLLRKYPDDWPEAEFWAFESAPGVGDVGPDDNYLSFSAVLLTTASRGNMTIRSANIRDPPVISPNWLTDERDVEQAYGVLQRLREIMSKADIVESEVLPGPEIASKKDMIQWLRDNMTYIFHGSSTCRMGVKGDPMAVVDSRARVYGVDGLRVVDASAFPFNPPGHPMSAVYMFAEKIAESILAGN